VADLMGPSRWTTMLGALALAAAIAVPAGATATAAEDLVRLVSPSRDATLVGGEPAILEWEPGPGLSAATHVEEWEAFLSLDGGRTFSVRLTPHLDLQVRRVAVRVPAVPSGDVRLLLRLGDERREVEQAIGGRYRIVLDGRVRPPAWRLRRPGAGEPARSGAAGVVVWAEGDRSGGGWEECEGLGELAGMRVAAGAGTDRRLAISRVRAAAPRFGRAPLAALAVVPPQRAADCVAGPAAATERPPLLSMHCRRNV
jgi:hypothetical protein